MKAPEERIEHILQRMLNDRSKDAPAASIKQAKELYRTRVVEKPVGILRRIKALVTADMRPGQLAFGERSGGTAQARQMLFEAGENAVDLRITRTKDTLEIRGQILGLGFDNCEIQLSDGDSAAKAKADADATFLFENVRAGKYDLTATGDTIEIVIEQVMLD